MSNVFIVSDTHFFHKNVIGYENRPFKDVDEMNLKMIDAWNQTVSKRDVVIHLGDVSFAGKKNTKDVINSLNGYKRLVMGNHDRDRTRTWWLDAGFDEVSREPIIYKGFYILSHEPVYINDNMPYVNVHGHIHSQKYENRQYFNACVEHWNYRPFLFDEVVNFYKTESESE